MSPSPALIVVFCWLLSPALHAAPDLSARSGVSVGPAAYDDLEVGLHGAAYLHLAPSWRTGMTYTYGARVATRNGPNHALSLTAQGRLDMFKTVPWIALGPRVETIDGGAGGAVLELGFEVLSSPAFAWGLVLGQQLMVRDRLVYGPSLGFFGNWTMETSSPF